MLKIVHEGSGEVFYATRLSAGFDICANVALTIPPGEWRLIATGMRILEALDHQKIQFGSFFAEAVPELQIRPRSGLAAKFGVTVLNSPSTIDADYRGEIFVNLINLGPTEFVVNKGDRIAQGIGSMAIKIPGITIKDVERGSGGFGSTGKSVLDIENLARKIEHTHHHHPAGEAIKETFEPETLSKMQEYAQNFEDNPENRDKIFKAAKILSKLEQNEE